MNQRFQQIKERINAAVALSGRTPGTVELLAVSKGQPLEKIQALFALGQKDFAENYLQEAEEKIKCSNSALAWHFIGPIQSNKTKKIADLFEWVHGLDRLSVAERLNRHCEFLGKHLNVCIQVNISREASKSGVLKEDINELVMEVCDLPHLRLRGLMAIPSKTQSNDAFEAMGQIYKSLKIKNCELDTLSMGMSNDFESAIAAGSTLVRVGTALFGART